MRIALTGHTSGIGKALVQQCRNGNDTIIFGKLLWTDGEPILGFSRRNGYDINDPAPIIRETLAKKCDVFINNAHDKFAQVDLLYGMWHFWKDQDKQIICISSLAPDVTKNSPQPYSTEKNALDHACEQLQNSKGKCRVINIKPGYVDTPRVAHRNVAHKIDPNYMAGVILWCIRQSEYLMTLRIAPWPDPGSET